MKTPLNKKSTVKEIKTRFDQDVERFSNLETAQQAVVDAPIMLEANIQTCCKRQT